VFQALKAATPLEDFSSDLSDKVSGWWAQLGDAIISQLVWTVMLFAWAVIFWLGVSFVGSKFGLCKVVGPIEFTRKYFKGVMMVALASPAIVFLNMVLSGST
jgi:hypothetical protein